MLSPTFSLLPLLIFPEIKILFQNLFKIFFWFPNWCLVIAPFDIIISSISLHLKTFCTGYVWPGVRWDEDEDEDVPGTGDG